jgi:ribosomal protein S18 acetylase RimI-like enzyme
MAHVAVVDHRDPLVARQIHAVLALAHAQEAELLQVKDSAPLQRGAAQIEASDEFYLGAFIGLRLVGSLSLGRDDEPAQIIITSLVVHPQCQRQGIGRALLLEAVRRAAGSVLSVATALNNVPALDLYRSLGFVEYRWGTLGAEGLALVKLRRPHSP